MDAGSLPTFRYVILFRPYLERSMDSTGKNPPVRQVCWQIQSCMTYLDYSNII